jgi:hypothetical protein
MQRRFTNRGARKGKKMTKTGRYKISPTKGRQREFDGTLLKTFNLGKKRLAILSVPKP